MPKQGLTSLSHYNIPKKPKKVPQKVVRSRDLCFAMRSVFDRQLKYQMVNYDQVFLKTWSRANNTTKSASTMHQHLYQSVHQPCTITYNMCLNHQPCTSTMYIKTCTIQCTKNVSQPYTIYHITQSCHTPCTIGYIKQVPSMVYLNQVPTSPRYVSHTCVVMYQVYSSTMYQ
jgi:hypothetical protein